MKNTDARPIKKVLDLPTGYWQLFSYGPFASVPSAKQALWIKGFFRRVLTDSEGKIVDWTNQTLARDLPVGEMVAWHPGSIFDSESKRVFAPQPVDKKIRVYPDLRVEFSAANCKLVRRFDRLTENDDDLIFGDRGLNRTARDANVYFVLVQQDKRLPLLIPCATILQTFWGCSSNFLHMLLDSRFNDFDRYVISTEKSKVDLDSRRACVWLRQWSLDDDARFLASIAFSPVSIQRGKDIAGRLHSAFSEFPDQEVDRYLVALPPYVEPMTLEAEAMPVNTALGKVLYVQRILKSNYMPPFDELVFDRDNDGRSHQKIVDENGNLISSEVREKQQIHRLPTFTLRDEADSDYTFVQEHPTQGLSASSIALGKFHSIFSNFAKIKPAKLPQMELNFESGTDLFRPTDERWAGVVSTLPSTSQSAIAALGVDLVSGDTVNNFTDDDKSPVGEYLDGLIQQYVDGTNSAFSSDLPSGTHRITIEPIFPWLPNQLYEGKLTFSLPREVDDFTWAYLYADPEMTIRKRAICLKVTFFGNDSTKIGYVIDVEGRYQKLRDTTDQQNTPVVKAAPMLLLSRNAVDLDNPNTGVGSTFSLKFLRSLILKLVEDLGQETMDYGSRQGVRVKTRKHSKNGIQLKKLLEELLGIL